MKIAVTGKGGSGKTTIALYLSKRFSEKGMDVLAVDADPSLNLMAMFGYEEITPISEIENLVNERARTPEGLVKLNPRVDDLIDEYSIKIDKNLRVLAIGTVTKAGSGCLCPENATLRALLHELVLKRDEAVILDMEAGLEIMSRGTIKNIDVMLAITEPSYSSISVTKNLLRFADELDIKNSYIVANKIKSKNELKYLSEKLGAEIFHAIPYLEKIREISMSNELSLNQEFYNTIGELTEKLTE
ncbi:MAG TPA: carbon monoxide dehydrogenase [Candidatus Altiarchaeales archaeon]|nr:carbon monoxide dehydrogenase [Candidatus Altiarchaeales archaeon]